MPTAHELETFARDRREADRRYNDALTALDRALVEASARETVGGGSFAGVATSLIVFLQQITAFVETKDRELEGATSARVDALLPAIDAVTELRSQMAIVQRAIQMLTRDDGTEEEQYRAKGKRQTAENATQEGSDIGDRGIGDRDIANRPAGAGTRHDDVRYVAFEDQFRGGDDVIAEKLSAYVPIFAGRSNVVDLGCGRGEFLLALKSAGVSSRGVDTNSEMAAIARERGLAVETGDALRFLASAADGSFGGLMAAQVFEHLDPAYLVRLLDTAFSKLSPGAPIVIETINVACWLAFFSSYLRDLTHVRPLHPETLQYLLRASGFERVTIRYTTPVPDHMKMQPAHLPAEVLASADPAAQALVAVAHALNANAAVLNNLLFTSFDYAAIGYRS